MSDDAWADHVPAFIDRHYGSMRGVVRTHLMDAQLREHLPAPPARIVDIGGGAGNQSFPLAYRGHDVTIVDPSSAMLARAAQVRDSQAVDVARRVRLVHASGEEAVNHHDLGLFDAVLCHGVIPYVDDPAQLIAALCSLTRPGGLVSILAKNADAMAVRPALEGRWSDALRAFDEEHEVNSLGLHTRGDTVEALAAHLRAHGAEPVRWYGVRLFVETWEPDRQAHPDDVDDILAVELEASRRDPYRALSRLLHIVARRACADDAST